MSDRQPHFASVDVTKDVAFENNDDESLPLTRCLCGATWRPWNGPILSVYDDQPTSCGACGREFYFSNQIHVYQVIRATP